MEPSRVWFRPLVLWKLAGGHMFKCGHRTNLPESTMISKNKGSNELNLIGERLKYTMSSITSGQAAKVFLCFGICFLSGCKDKVADPKSEAPPPATLQRDVNASIVQVNHPERFPWSLATSYQANSAIAATCSVNPDISRTVPVISIASGRVVDMHARIGDYVKKGQLL